MRAGFCVLSERAKLRVTGADRIRFINGQTTNDVEKTSADSAQESCILNLKGHLEAHLFLRNGANEIWIDAEKELREPLAARLERYIIADDVVIEDNSDQFALFHLIGADPPTIAEAKYIAKARRLANEGWDIWTEKERAEETQQLLSRSFESFSAETWEQMRIEDGVPRWGHELTADIIPPEANLAARAIDYEKGCYIGQEVISRMKMSGRRNKSLCGLTAIHGNPFVAGMKLRPRGLEKKEAGWITSAAWSDRLGSYIALGFVRRGFNEIGTELDACDPLDGSGFAPVGAKVASLPFCADSPKM